MTGFVELLQLSLELCVESGSWMNPEVKVLMWILIL
jgi:hypothetical protein